ncbi:uncharacterized protein LOC118570649 [Onychomys torridus]|uniref:uncharacterized protein LOC118570649 n=1 Tax=Onychomys torridus TaxID=38674 RepID=UPI00167FB864|nr:uncharacterized protein LOC118570649 [Onychomys torridus]
MTLPRLSRPHTPARPPAPSSLAHLSPAAAHASGLLEVCFLFPLERSRELRSALLRSPRGRAGVARYHGAAPGGARLGLTHRPTDRRGGTKRSGAGAGDTSPAATPASTRQLLSAVGPPTLGPAHPGSVCRPAGVGRDVSLPLSAWPALVGEPPTPTSSPAHLLITAWEDTTVSQSSRGPYKVPPACSRYHMLDVAKSLDPGYTIQNKTALETASFRKKQQSMSGCSSQVSTTDTCGVS